MSLEKAPYPFTQMKHKYLWLRGTEILLWSLAIGLLSFYLLKLFTTSFLVTTTLACLLGCISAVLGSRYVRIFSTKEKDLARYLNRRYPELEESADLLLQKDEVLTSLQLLQKVKTVQRFEQLYPTIKFPHHIGRAASIFVVSMILSSFLASFSPLQKITKTATIADSRFTAVVKKNLPVSIKRCSITISPPSYTGLRAKMSNDFNIQIPEGSTVQWDVTFDHGVLNPTIIFSGRDSISITKASDNFKVNRTFTTSGFYQLTWQNSDSITQRSAYYKITVVEDHPPSIALENLNQFVELSQADCLKIHIASTLADDYGLTQANIIATVSKGSGEAIKFREEKLTFDGPRKILGKKIDASRLIDLVKLGLQPGDELYFYVEATDNKMPLPNRSRTETYFIAMKDTASQTTFIDASLGVDLMPEYFRSQRQIIIDSEKLLQEKKQIKKQNFNSRSNELGHDQKVLRLRYGQFLGEEFETNIGPSSSIGITEDQTEDVVEKFGHTHDKENEHNLVDENHLHDRTGSTADQKEDPLKDFVHAHDGADEATFFIQSIKAKLKAAITIMWDAELYLRLNQPEKSLPYQYKALKLLKEISQDSRIYVHRTGFDPPPLKEEKRLTGDLSEVKSSTAPGLAERIQELPAVRASIPVIEKLILDDTIAISPPIKDLFTRAGHELARLERKQPGGYLEILSWLQMLTQQESGPDKKTKNILRNVSAALWKVLPPKVASPQLRSGVIHDLDGQFLNSLEASKQIP